MTDTFPTVIRHAARQLARRPGSTVIIVLTLAVALGVNAMQSAMIDRLILHPLPFPGIDRLIQVSEVTQQAPNQRLAVSAANVEDWQRQATTIDLVAIGMPNVALAGGNEPERVQASRVSPAFFDMLGERPMMGRDFRAEEAQRGQQTRVIVSHRLWTRRFGSNPAIVGSTVTLDRVPYEVIGVARPEFDFPLGTNIWMPLAPADDERSDRERRTLMVIGRLRPGVTLDAARSELSVIGERLATEHPANKGRLVRVQTLTEGIVEPAMRTPVLMGQVSGVLLLLIGCANITGLLLARGVERQREVAIRLALGASRRQIVRDLCVESALLGLISVPFALGAAHVALGLLKASMPPRTAAVVAGWETMQIDLPVALATLGLAVLATTLMGLVPARHVTRPHLSALIDGGRGNSMGNDRQRLRRALVVMQVAFVLPLLVLAGLSARGTSTLLYGDQGYDPTGVLTLQTQLLATAYPDADAQRRFERAALDRIRAVRGIMDVAVANTLPASGNPEQTIEAEGQPRITEGDPDVDLRLVSGSYFSVMRIPVVEGRAFADTDGESGQDVAIVSRALAQRYWPGTSALGKRVRYAGNEPGRWLTIVGIAGDVIHDAFISRREPTLYRPLAQSPVARLSFAVRAAGGDPTALAPEVRAAVRELDREQPVFNVMSQRQALDDRLIALRQLTVSSWSLGLLALGLGLIGLYGVMAYFVSQRAHDLGVRVALGATRRHIGSLVLGQAGRLLTVGVVIGALLAAGLSRIFEAIVIGTGSLGVGLVLAAALAMAVVGLAAAYGPARRAMRLDPVAALRNG